MISYCMKLLSSTMYAGILSVGAAVVMGSTPAKAIPMTTPNLALHPTAVNSGGKPAPNPVADRTANGNGYLH